MASKMSSARPNQGDPAGVGGRLSSKLSHYRVESVLGRGSFGTVAKCTRMLDGKSVAIKMMKNRASACAEVATLLKLRSLDSDKCNLVQWYQAFTCKGYNCLVFEHLDKSLHDFMKERHFRPLPPKEIRPIVQQLATALHHLRDIGMIHADLKMENVMLVNHEQEPYRVKLIDFGLARETSAAHLGSYIQSRPYRSPEIILGLTFTEAIDVWSLGCLAATLYLGYLLYPGRSEYDMMRYIVETQGQPPDELLILGLKTNSFFQKDKSSTTSLWKLKTPEQVKVETGIQAMETRKRKLRCLCDLLNIRRPEESADKYVELNDALMFVDLLSQMLELDASKRITPLQILERPFISMRHIDPNSSYARSCFDIMDVCQKKTPASDSGKSVCGSVPQPSSGTAYPVQQNLPYSAERSGPSQPHHISPCVRTLLAKTHPSNMSQSQNYRPGVKRKADDQDVGHWHMNTYHHKRSEDGRKRFRRSAAVGPSTSSSGSWTRRRVSPRVERRMVHGERRERSSLAGPSACGHDSERTLRVPSEHRRRHHNSAQAPTGARTESWARSERKRKAADDDVLHGDRTSGPMKRERGLWSVQRRTGGRGGEVRGGQASRRYWKVNDNHQASR